MSVLVIRSLPAAHRVIKQMNLSGMEVDSEPGLGLAEFSCARIRSNPMKQLVPMHVHGAVSS